MAWWNLTVKVQYQTFALLQFTSTSLQSLLIHGVTESELGQKVQRQSPEAQYPWNQGACGGLHLFKYGCCLKEALNSETWILHTHVKIQSGFVIKREERKHRQKKRKKNPSSTDTPSHFEPVKHVSYGERGQWWCFYSSVRKDSKAVRLNLTRHYWGITECREEKRRESLPSSPQMDSGTLFIIWKKKKKKLSQSNYSVLLLCEDIEPTFIKGSTSW